MSFNPTQLPPTERSAWGGGGGEEQAFPYSATFADDSMHISRGGAEADGDDDGDEYRDEDECDREEAIREDGEEGEGEGEEERGGEGEYEDEGNDTDCSSDKGDIANDNDFWSAQQYQQQQDLYDHGYAVDADSVMWTSQRNFNAENVVNGNGNGPLRRSP